jgi:hypothetical protein
MTVASVIGGAGGFYSKNSGQGILTLICEGSFSILNGLR